MPAALDRLVLRVWSRMREYPCDRGAALTEYGTLLFFVAVACVAILLVFGGEIMELFQDTETDFSDARDNPAPAD